MAPTFVLIGHPANASHLQTILECFDPKQRRIRPELLTAIFKWTPAHVLKQLEDVQSKTGARRTGIIITATLLPEMVDLTPDKALQKVLDTCVLANKQGAKIAALGGYTSIAGCLAPDRLQGSVANAVTTGNTCTVAMAVQQIRNLATELTLPLHEMTLAVIGGAGDIGSACAEILCSDFGSVVIAGRKRARLISTAERIQQRRGKAIAIADANKAAVADADVVIATTSAVESIFEEADFKPGAIVSDVGYPKNIRKLSEHRADILVFPGGVCRTPYPIEFGYDHDLPRNDLLFGCFAEALLLDFEENYCNFSMGRWNITEDKAGYMLEVGEKHGFVPAPPCQYGEFLGRDAIRQIIANNPRFR